MNNQYKVKIVESLSDISAFDWDSCANSKNPTVSHGFLSALEDSKSVTIESGWKPQHIIISDSKNKVSAVTPLYLKSHSYGEYVFDWGWAEAYERYGGQYYPKIQCSVPFTPITGPRLLTGESSTSDLKELLASSAVEYCSSLGASSVHLTFLPKKDWRMLGAKGWLRRTGEQFHWQNKGYQNFDDFLSELSSRKRKNIKKERQNVLKHNLEIKIMGGSEITEAMWDSFYNFYKNTSEKKWGYTYLKRSFFSLISQRIPEKILLIMAFENGSPVAGALNLCDKTTLYGRNWGCIEDYKFLHFELCYYQAIEYAISCKLSSVEAGAQGGEHKLRRGYLPVPTYSVHWIQDPLLRDAIARFLISERSAVEDGIGYLARYSPFKQKKNS